MIFKKWFYKYFKARLSASNVVSAILLAFIFLENFGHSDYLILQKITDEPKSLSDYLPVKPDDKNAQILYEIKLRYSWPTSLAYPNSPDEAEVHEEDALNAALAKHELTDYQYFWIPDSLHELALMNHFVEKYQKDLATNHPFCSGNGNLGDITEQITDILETASLNLLDQQGPPLEEIGKIGTSLEIYGKEDFYESGSVLFNLIADLEKEHASMGSSLAMSPWKDRLTRKEYTETLVKLRSLLVKRHHQLSSHPIKKEAFRSAGRTWMFRSKGQSVVPMDEALDSGKLTFIDQVTNNEIAAHLKNHGLLYRGTDGYHGKLDGSGNYSLSYGTSLFAGAFTDCAEGKGACAYGYMISTDFPYLLPMDKNKFHNNRENLRDMFYIPSLGITSRLFGCGELFHARSKVGFDSFNESDGIGGICPFGISKPLLKLLMKLEILGSKLTADQFKVIFDQHLNDHAIELKPL